MKLFTREDAYVAIKRCIEAGPCVVEEFDMNGILDEIGDLTQDIAVRWDIEGVDDATFWEIVQRHAKAL